MANIEFWLQVLDASGVLALAVFSIWMLQRSYKERADMIENDRDRLAEVVERNTTAWQENTRALAKISASVAIVAEATSRNTDNINRVLLDLARRIVAQDRSKKRTKDDADDGLA